MKILYGVQATGQGHISRARAMAAALARCDAEVTWLFSGRPREALFDMEPFGEFLHRRGLSFATRAGRIRYRATLRSNNIPAFLRDVRALDVARYDAIVTDYEPVTAWAARCAGVPAIGIGHQYGFGPGTPRAGRRWWTECIMRNFAPVDTALGLHWHPYADNVLPPILDLPDMPLERAGHILVYLPFEDQEAITRRLRRLSDHRFVQYANGIESETRGNVLRQRANIDGFKRHLASCSGVICNSGFELISECLQWGKPVLTKPLEGQMEQLSNALALQQLGYATTVADTGVETLGGWLREPHRAPALTFPDVAPALARWLADGQSATPAQLASSLWNTCDQSAAAAGPVMSSRETRKSTRLTLRKLGQSPQIS